MHLFNTYLIVHSILTHLQREIASRVEPQKRVQSCQSQIMWTENRLESSNNSYHEFSDSGTVPKYFCKK